jgi:hypothetical protein
VLIVSFLAAYLFRGLPRFNYSYGSLSPLHTYLWMLWVIVPTWLWLVHRYRLDRPIASDSLISLFLRLVKVHVLGSLVLLTSVYLVDRLEVSRLLTQLFLSISGVLLLLDKL